MKVLLLNQAEKVAVVALVAIVVVIIQAAENGVKKVGVKKVGAKKDGAGKKVVVRVTVVRIAVEKEAEEAREVEVLVAHPVEVVSAGEEAYRFVTKSSMKKR